ncbi:YciI family protein [Nocardia farcinica]|uniref:YciI family protein n=1 Tax=Nocardia TaxID=1817 RepID=UPI000A38BE0E|nr:MULTISPECIES: YciI family protein [Nocardia]MBA4859320.1 YciI family protein [Nocardia farcinica]MBC9816146.1 YciI family protein [Nocardia farcinica]MBF6068264.1 YciI family protein [Nocardia farcinica]MBF6140524.1 YciI family protein [Nocardia farcinica]MBF6186299.1 YciI family protein [Nocardia farcinica]
MRYMLLFHYPEETEESLGAEAMASGRQQFAAYAATLEQAGVLVSGQVLQPSDRSTTLRLVDGRLRIQDGPYADTKEQLGGVMIIDVPDLDAALDLARQAPPLGWGCVEIRPGAVHTEDGVWVPS